MSKFEPEADLANEALAARQLIENLRANDDGLCCDMVEGETGFFEALDRVLEAITEDEAIVTGAAAMIDKLAVRQKSAKERIAWRKASIETAMLASGLPKSLRRATATVTLKKSPAALGELEEAEIPSQFYKPQPPKLDRAGLLKALKDLPEGETIPGASLKPGAETIQIRRA